MLAMLSKCGSKFTCKVTILLDVDRDGEGKKSNRSMSSRPSHVKLQWVPTLTLTKKGVLVRNRICMQPIERAEYALKRIHLFSLGVGSMGNYFYNIFIFVFPPCSSKGVPNSTTLLCIPYGLSKVLPFSLI